MIASILSIGDELALGQTVDTNSAWISKQLSSVGCDIAAHMTVPDSQAKIVDAIKLLSAQSDCLIISGGIGPTEDDLTRQSLAEVMNAPLELSEKWLETMLAFFTKLGRPMPETNKIQAMIPKGATMIENTAGTAAGLRATVGKCEIFVTPGVPKEMKAMFNRDIFPWITQKSGGAVILQKTLHTFGAGESTVAEKIGKQMMRDQNPSVGTTVANGYVSLRINARFNSKEEAQKQIDQTIAQCREKLGDLIWGEDQQSLVDIVAQLLRREGSIGSPTSEDAPTGPRVYTVSTAESCTGGLLSKMLTDLPGSSDYFKMGFITYSNKAKYERLGVSEQIINTYGAVSEPVVDLMARAAKRLTKTHFALAISGIAGPGGGSAQKPVGTVCISLAYDKSREEVATTTRTFMFSGDREMIRDRSAKMALTMLRFHLLQKPMPF